MPDVPDDVKDSINSEFVRRMEEKDPPTLDVLIETEPGAAQAVEQQVRGVSGASIGEAGSFGGKYVAAVVPQEEVPTVARMPNVVQVSQDQPTGVLELPAPTPDIPFLTAENDPVRTMLSDMIYEAFMPDDEYIGQVRISEVEVPRVNFAQLPPGDPFQTAVSLADKYAGTEMSGQNIVSAVEVVDWIRDSNLTDGAISSTSKVGIIDTGHTPTEPENGGRAPHLESYVPGEPPFDGMCHGSFCTNMVTGYPAPSAFGTTAGVAPGSVYGHFKALNTFPGFGKSSWILKAMTGALEWGADVISMSLGGTQQGSLDEDPYARFIRENCKENAGDEAGALFVAAAGNSGADKWTIGSPGVAEKALTVGAWSLTDGAPSSFSSRGPQGAWYKENPDVFEQHRQKYGDDEFLAPDVVAPGGGRETAEKSEAEGELLYQSSTGWYDGLKTGLRDTRSAMRGTSMATPAVAGLVKRLYDAGIISTVAEVKQVARERGSLSEFPEAHPTANETAGAKNVAAGFGPIRESLFDPRA